MGGQAYDLKPERVKKIKTSFRENRNGYPCPGIHSNVGKAKKI